MNLLEKIRKINRLLQTNIKKEYYYKEISHTLSEVLNADTVIAAKNGELLSFSIKNGLFNDSLSRILEKGRLPDDCNEKLMEISVTIPNIEDLVETPEKLPFNYGSTTVIPIFGSGERLGTVLLTKHDRGFQPEDLIIGEYGSAVVGFELLRSEAEKREEKARNKASIKMAISSLSYSELEAVEHIFAELDGNEGLIVASNIADKKGITRSVIVNALRKLEGAGIINSRSLGMKGTFIKVLNDQFLPELHSMRVS